MPCHAIVCMRCIFEAPARLQRQPRCDCAGRSWCWNLARAPNTVRCSADCTHCLQQEVRLRLRLRLG
ncbi:hypothetical protein GQ607_003235 [Colletotrichum asianum]|uniref:Uncharacterized protein n=1 Tax=Colletotrichum asianum TaxID=702518 RepID=A0A8H3WPP1_9PEZI|nr:hypothetical protein GQ607_003235 [Colletotrichum asianum]